MSKREEKPIIHEAEKHFFKVPIYGTGILLVRSDPKTLVRFVKKYAPDADNNEEPPGVGRSLILTSQGRSAIVVLWLGAEATMSDPWWMNVLAHECWHSTCFICKDVGIPLSRETEETHAYLLGWLMQACLERLKPSPRRVKLGERKR